MYEELDRYVEAVALVREHNKPYLNGGIFELPQEWITGGRLTWHGADGKVYAPTDRVRAHRLRNVA